MNDEHYRDLNHNLVGLKLCVLYEDEGEWFDGTITWYNTQLGKLRVLFEDDSDDYISPEDINGVDVFLKTWRFIDVFEIDLKTWRFTDVSQCYKNFIA